jgi:adenylylsulfate kinase
MACIPFVSHQREMQNGHRGKVVWLTGLPGSGKSTIAHAVEANLHRTWMQTIVLGADNIRHDLCGDLGLSLMTVMYPQGGDVAKLFLMQGAIIFVALVSRLISTREKVRQLIPDSDLIEIYCNCLPYACTQRDPKRLYENDERGLVAGFASITSPYEAPLAPNLNWHTEHERIVESVGNVVRF